MCKFEKESKVAKEVRRWKEADVDFGFETFPGQTSTWKTENTIFLFLLLYRRRYSEIKTFFCPPKWFFLSLHFYSKLVYINQSNLSLINWRNLVFSVFSGLSVLVGDNVHLFLESVYRTRVLTKLWRVFLWLAVVSKASVPQGHVSYFLSSKFVRWMDDWWYFWFQRSLERCTFSWVYIETHHIV